MRIVDKYGLAKYPFGTVFYEVVNQAVKSGPKILVSHTFYLDDGTPMFNGVQYLEPNAFDATDKDIVVGTEIGINEIGNDYDKDDLWFCVDDDSNCYDDRDMFLVLEKEEAISLLGLMFDLIVKRGYKKNEEK